MTVVRVLHLKLWPAPLCQRMLLLRFVTVTPCWMSLMNCLTNLVNVQGASPGGVNVRTPKMIQFGKFDISTWYSSPYPQVNKFDPTLPTIHGDNCFRSMPNFQSSFSVSSVWNTWSLEPSSRSIWRSVLGATRPGWRSTGRMGCQCLRWMATQTRSIARTCVCSSSCSLITRRSTTTWSPSCSMSSHRMTAKVVTWWATSARSASSFV